MSFEAPPAQRPRCIRAKLRTGPDFIFAVVDHGTLLIVDLETHEQRVYSHPVKAVLHLERQVGALRTRKIILRLEELSFVTMHLELNHPQVESWEPVGAPDNGKYEAIICARRMRPEHYRSYYRIDF